MLNANVNAKTNTENQAVVPQISMSDSKKYDPASIETKVLGSEDNIIAPVLKHTTRESTGGASGINVSEKPQISARSVLSTDVSTDETLYEKNPKLILAPASTTKLMTAMVALDTYKLNDVLVVPEECVKLESTRVGFPQDSKFKVIDLLYSMLASSAGDAACTFAYGATEETVNDKSYLSNYDRFVLKMNEKAKDLKMKNTFFTNAVGLDGYASSHYSTAEDLYVLAKEAVKNENIKEIVKTKNYVINSLDGKFNYSGQNTNKLLWDLDGTVGVKTGTTQAAGEVLIYEYKKDNKDIIIIVMGSTDRFTDTTKILNWILNNYEWK